MEGELNKCGLLFCRSVCNTSVSRSGGRPSQCYGQIASPHMTATHSQTDRYKHIAFTRQERQLEGTKKKEINSLNKLSLAVCQLFFLFTAKHSFCSPVHFELTTPITVLISTILYCGRDIEPRPSFKQKAEHIILDGNAS